MGSIAVTNGTSPETEAVEWPTYWVDTTPWGWVSDGVYTRQRNEILGGESEEPDDASGRQARCFNCGSQEHMLSDCTQNRNHVLITLSRSMYQFFNATAGLGNWKRVHDVEEWRQQRLHWLEDFEPGQIRGALLQDALGGQDGDWLKNMAVWGYPAGWVGHEDPRKQVKHRIWNENLNGAVDDLVNIDEPFLIHGDGDQFEEVSFSSNEKFQLIGDTEDFDTTSGSESDESTGPSRPPKRWAQFTDSQFSSTLLPIYNGIALPMLPGQDTRSFSSTFSADRQGLWHRIIAGQNPYPSLSEDFPWLPPPPEDPPPIQPPPPPGDPPPLPPLLCSSPPVSTAVSNFIDTEVDMDMSD